MLRVRVCRVRAPCAVRDGCANCPGVCSTATARPTRIMGQVLCSPGPGVAAARTYWLLALAICVGARRRVRQELRFCSAAAF